MNRIGLYFNVQISNEAFIKHIFSRKKKENNVFYSNLLHKECIFFENKNDYNSLSREKCRKEILNLSEEFYNLFSNTVLFNNGFNFWGHLRFNSFLQLLRFYKIRVWIDQLKTQEDVDEIFLFDVDSNSIELLRLFYPDLNFYTTQSTKNENVGLFKLIYKLFQVFKVGSNILFKKNKPSADTLFFSLKGSIMPILSKDGIIKEDKFMYYIQNKFPKDAYQTFLNSKIYSKKEILNFKYDSNYKKFDFTNENLLFLLGFDFGFIKNLFKVLQFIKNLKKQKKTLLTTLILNNRKGLFSELVAYRSYYKFLKKSSYKNIVLIGEMNPTLNSIVRASKQLGINSVGIQHGLLNKENIAYNFSSKELKIDNPFPNKLIVWGEDEKHFLDKEKEILKETIQAKGNIVFDGIRYLKPIDSNRKYTFMYASQPQPIMENRMKSINDFVNSMLMFDKNEIKIIVRLHPGEFNDFEIYKESLNKLKNYDFELDKGNEIVSQLNKIDVLVTSFSTVAKDALILKKPIVLQDYSNTDITGLLSKEIALNATNENELFYHLNKFKNNEIKVDEKKYDFVLSKMFAATNLNVADEVIKLLR